MAADTYDPVLGLILQGTGNNNNSWGTTLNNSMIKIAARATAGLATQAVTGGTLDLSGTPPPASVRQDVDQIQRITGVLVSAQTIIVPNLSKTWLFRNDTTGAFHVYVKTTAGTAVQIPQGTAKLVYWVSSNVLKRLDEDEVGSIRISGKAAVGSGELQCNGASLLRTDYPDLFSKISTTWGAADGTHFTLPDFVTSNRFLRSSGGALSVGTTQTSQNLTHTHTGSGTSTGGGTHTHTYSGSGTSGASDRSLAHYHSGIPTATGTIGDGSHAYGGFSYMYPTGANTGSEASPDHLHSIAWSGTTTTSGSTHEHSYSFTTTGGSADGTEARPVNAVVLMCIKF